MLVLENVSKSYRKRSVLSDISHRFDAGLNVLTGPSGAGKSTLLRLCATVERPSSGALSWQGQSYSKAKRRVRRDLGYAPQIVDLPLDITGLEFLQHIAALKGVGRDALSQSRDLLEAVGLGADADQRLIGWSGGMRRRLIFAQALLGAPKLIVLDEPTAELDSETASRVSDLIAEKAKTATVLLTTHLTAHFQTQGARLIRVADGGLTLR
ncbi:MAG: ATP-binding cassette domain-containing protein [Pseudomonadota bacterium]